MLVQPEHAQDSAAAPRNGAEFVPPEGYWDGSAKVVWAAVLALFIGLSASAGAVHALMTIDFSNAQAWTYPLLTSTAAVAASLPVGAILLLCRRAAGRITLHVGIPLIVAVFAYGSYVTRDDGTDAGGGIGVGLCLVVILGLINSKSAKRWLAGRRA